MKNSKIKYEKIYDKNHNLIYKGKTKNGKPYGKGITFFANGNKYQEGIFGIKGLVAGKEYYPNGQLRFKGKYEICRGYGPNYPIEGEFFDVDGTKIYSGKFEIKKGGVGYPMIKKPKSYRPLVQQHPKISYFMWSDDQEE